jgi:hypothetical protein
MARKTRGLLITLCVIVGLFIVAIVAVRLLLTRERLLAIVIPRIEKAVDAKVSMRDIGISFPFGLGVDIDELTFDKTLPDTSTLAFSSKRVTVRSSLMSLLRRKPEIKAADVQGGTVIVGNARKHREIKLLGLDSHFSMKPAAEGFSLSAKALIDSVLVSPAGRPPAIVLREIGFDGELESDRNFTRLAIRDSRVRWADLVAARVQGEVANIRTAPRVTLTVESAEKPLAPLLERVRSFRLDELAPAAPQAAGTGVPMPPVAVSAGTFEFNVQIDGLAGEPLAMSLSFECTLKDLAIKSGDLASIAKLGASFKGQGVALAWRNLFPGPSQAATAAQLSLAWQAVKLDGTVELEGGDFVVQPPGESPPGGSDQAPPIRISSLKAKAGISGPDVKKISGECNVGSSPYRFSGSMINIMPASAELALTARKLQVQAAGGKEPADLGVLLDRMVNVPVVKFEVAGRSFDARPYEKPLAGAPAERKTSAPAPARAPAPPGADIGALLFLKNTSFTATLDSIVAREAVITKFEAKGTIRDGRVKVDPATFAYAGGAGTTVVSADLRAPARAETKVDVSISGVEASQALARLGTIATLVQGTFSVKSNASFVTGSGVNPFMTLAAAGSALSSKGTVSFERFIEPLTKIEGFDVTPFKQFDFNEWRGNFVVKDGRVSSDDWKINSSRGAWLIKGSFGFDGTLDYAVHAVIPPNVQSMMKGLDQYKSVFDLMRDKAGNLVLDVNIKGTAKRPSASLDLTQAKSKVQDKVIEELKKKFLH